MTSISHNYKARKGSQIRGGRGDIHLWMCLHLRYNILCPLLILIKMFGSFVDAAFYEHPTKFHFLRTIQIRQYANHQRDRFLFFLLLFFGNIRANIKVTVSSSSPV